MPWSSSDAKKHKKGLSSAQSRKWAKIANAVLSDSGDEGKAIRIANSKTESVIGVFGRIERILEDDLPEPERELDVRDSTSSVDGIRVSVDGKEIGVFPGLGSAVEGLTSIVKDIELPIRWDLDGKSFTSSNGKEITFVYVGSEGEEPLDDESQDDVELLIASELNMAPMFSKPWEDDEPFGENEDFGATPDNEEESGEEDRDEDAGGSDTGYETDNDGGCEM